MASHAQLTAAPESSPSASASRACEALSSSICMNQSSVLPAATPISADGHAAPLRDAGMPRRRSGV